MSTAMWVWVGAGILGVIEAVSFVIWVIRTILRVLALRSAVMFYQAPGINGSVIILAKQMFTFLVRGSVSKTD